MDSQQDSPKPPPALVFWIIWFAILNGLVMIQFFVGGGIPKGEDLGKPPMEMIAVAAGLGLVALSIRFLWIPQIESVVKRLPAMIVGLAMSEAIGFVGIFGVGKEFPATRQALFVAAVACIVSLVPVYAKPRVENGRF